MKIGFWFLVVLMSIGIGASRPPSWILKPTYFPEPKYDFSKNPFQASMIELGRNLFYDPRLSADSSISCASCHSPYNAFAHTDHALSHGINDSIGFRNAPALFNLAWQNAMMWDGAIHHIELQALAPLEAKNEMGAHLPDVLNHLNGDPWYKQQFKIAWGDSVIHGEQFLKALAQFQLSLVSNQSRYDSMRRKEVKFTLQEETGYALFKTHCNTCHREPLFSSYTWASNGLPLNAAMNDKGRMRVTQLERDSGLFKIPSLRNTAYTFPYMHDGRFKQLRDVLHHYNTHSLPNKKRIKLNANEQSDLLAFMRTLNDRHFVFDTTHTFPQALKKQLEGF